MMSEKAMGYSLNALNIDETALSVSSDELLNLNSHCRGGYADLPKQWNSRIKDKPQE